MIPGVLNQQGVIIVALPGLEWDNSYTFAKEYTNVVRTVRNTTGATQNNFAWTAAGLMTAGGKYYVEVVWDVESASNNEGHVGFSWGPIADNLDDDSSANLSLGISKWNVTDVKSYLAYDGLDETSRQFTCGIDDGDVIGMACDTTNGKLWVKNITKGTGWLRGGNPAADTLPTVEVADSVGATTAWNGGYNALAPRVRTGGLFGSWQMTLPHTLVEAPPAGFTSVGASVPIPVFDPWRLGTDLLLTNGRLTVEKTAGAAFRTVQGYPTLVSGKWYWEFNLDHKGVVDYLVGAAGNMALANFVGQDQFGWGYQTNGRKYHDNTPDIDWGPTSTTGDIIGVAVDLDAGNIWFSKNGVWMASGNPSTGANPAFSGLDHEVRPTVTLYTYDAVNPDKVTGHFSADDLVYSKPTGFLALDET